MATGTEATGGDGTESVDINAPVTTDAEIEAAVSAALASLPTDEVIPPTKQPPATPLIPETAKKPDAEPPAKVEDPAATPAPATQKESALLRAVTKREAKLVEERKKFQTERQQAVTQIEASRRELDARLAPYEERERLAAADPFAYLEKVHGMTAQDVARRLLNNGKAAPDESVRRAESRVDALERKIAEGDRAREQADQARAAQADVAGRRAAFVKGIRDSVTKYPNLALDYDDDAELLEDAVAIDTRLRAQNLSYSGQELAEFMERRAAKRAGKRGQQDSTSTTKETAQAGKGTANGSGPEGSQAGNASTALTNGSSAGGTTIPKITVDMDPDAERRHLIEVANRAIQG